MMISDCYKYSDFPSDTQADTNTNKMPIIKYPCTLLYYYKSETLTNASELTKK